MIQIIIGNTYSKIPEALGINPEAGFQQVILNLKDIKQHLQNACILYSSLDELLYLFSQFEFISFNSAGTYIYADNYTGLYRKIGWQWEPSRKDKTHTIHEAWLQIMNDLSEDIDELFRYSFTPEDKTVIFLNNILKFLANTHIACSQTTIEHYRT